MFVDASAIVAILTEEPDGPALTIVLETTEGPITSAIAIWVLIDSRERARALSYDFGSWVFLLPLFVGPYYVFSTRGLRAFALLGKFFSFVWQERLLA